MDKVAEMYKRIARALKRCGWENPSDLLIKEALVFLKKNDVVPDNYKTISAWLHDFHPAIPPLEPSPERKYIELCILAQYCALEIAGSFDERPVEERTAEVEAMVRKAAKINKPPYDVYAREIALRYDIAFEGKRPPDCFGYWEPGNRLCSACTDQEACRHLVDEAGMGAMANPALKEFGVPEPLRKSAPLSVCRVEKNVNEGTLAALGDRKLLISWIGSEFPTLTRIDYTESVNFQIAHPYRKRLVLLKIEKFTTKSYSVVFSAISDAQAATFGLTKVRGNWAHIAPDIVKLQAEIRDYLAVAMDIPAISVVLSKEEEMKQEIERDLTENWTGVLEHRADHDVLIDSRRQKILRLSRFPTKGIRVDFSRWGREKAAEHGLRYTSSGARYEGSDRAELERLLQLYLHSIKSVSFGPRNEIISESSFL